VTVEREADRIVVRLRGEIDLVSVPALRDELLAMTGKASVVVDLAAVTFLDATGVGVLVGAHKRLANQGGRLVLVNPPPAIARVLQLAGVAHLLES
jgi:anti-anti-sigma factor